MPRIMRTVGQVFAVAITLTIFPSAQSKQPPGAADFGKWEALLTVPRGLSPDGQWLAHGINRSNRNNELRIVNVGDGRVTVAAFGSQAAFSADSRWAAYAIGHSEAEEEKLRQQKKPVHRKLGLLNLASGETTTVEGIEAFAFNASGTHLAMKRYAPERKDQSAQPPAAEPEEPLGITLIVRELSTGRDTTFGNVTEYAWQDKGRLLALVIGAEDKTGNGVQLFDPVSGALRVLDSSSSTYAGLTWRKEADDLVALRAKLDPTRDGPTHVALAWRGLGTPAPLAATLEPAAKTGIPAGMRTVSFRRPAWSEDGRIVFLGIAKWDEKPAEPKSTPNGNGDADPNPDQADDAAAVDVWHSRDVDVMPRQKINARNDRQRSLLAAWHVDDNRLVPLGTELHERTTPIKRSRLAYAATWPAYAMDRSIGRPAADLSLIDVDTGNRSKVIDRIEDQYLQASPAGRYLLYFQADHYWTVDTATRTVTNITKSAPTVFANRESDATIKQKPPFGVAGWTKDDEAVLLYDKFDVWQVASNGSAAIRLTDGVAEQVRHR